ncbi:MAG: serine/threonine-protein kinase [Sciscionella sp.]
MKGDLTGRRLGHYRIDGVLGKGGMSVLYRATDIRLGRQVALKVIGEHLTEDPEFRERFVDEARNTSAIDHPNVVPLYDFGEVEGLLYIALRMVDGADLAKLAAQGPLAPARVIALLAQVADALDTVHGRGLVHLDVKPANVLVTTKEARGEHVYLADFGLTRRGATGHRTRAGDFLGSPTYAAPEHLRGEPVDARTDGYSLACVLFACLAGRPPFRGEVQDVIAGHLNGEAPEVTSFVPLPASIEVVLARGMAKDPARRYSSCRELIGAAQDALGTAARGQRVRQPPPGMPGPFGTGPTFPPAPQWRPPTYQRPITPTGAEPVRLRPPLPARSGAFSAAGSPPASSRRWVLPALIVAVVVVAVVLVLVFTLGGPSVEGSGGVPDSQTASRDTGVPSSLPNVPVGQGGATSSAVSHAPLPSVLPTVTR